MQLTMNVIHSRFCLVGEDVVGYHNDKPHICAIMTIGRIPLTPDKVLYTEGTRLLRKLPAKRGIAGDDDSDPCALGKNWAKDRD